ncbi:MAG: FecR domain-containing protein [Myxococcota bacterium]|nr:FecR domain-containing protein [Myxococcota bacterium]MDW8363190.1 FecR domain-containing protein [Myxococcales bacterium]
MTAHPPKTSALLALEAGLLSEEGRRRLQRHLEQCEGCRRHHAALVLYDRLRRAAATQPAPELDWGRLEAALRAAAHDASSRARRGALARRLVRPAVYTGVLAAAAAWLLWLDARPEPTPASPVVSRSSPTTEPADAPSRSAAPEELRAMLVAVAGEVRLAETLADVGAIWSQGQRLATGQQAQAHVLLMEGTALVAGAQTSMTALRLARDEIRLELETGEVSSAVARRTPPLRYVVSAGSLEAHVRGTLFRVARDDSELAVDVTEGIVELVRDGTRIAWLQAPASWTSSARGARLARAPRPPSCTDESCTRWPVLRLPAPRAPARWTVGEATLHDVGAIAMRVPAGELSVELFDGRRTLRTTAVIGEAGLTLRPDALRPTEPAVREGWLAPELIASVVRAGRPGLMRCRDAVSRGGLEATGSYVLTITVDGLGAVSRVRVERTDGPVHDELARCLRSEIERWDFPPPRGGPVTFTQPLRFATRVSR